MKDRTKATLEKLKSLVPNDRAYQEVFGLQLGLADSQWYSAETLERYQLDRLKDLARFALREMPYWRERVSLGTIERAAGLNDALGAFPILTRADLRDHYSALCAVPLPPGHEVEGERKTSGSTGMLVKVQSTNVASAWQNALNFRVHLWAGRDFSKSLAVIRRMKEGTADHPGIRARAWDVPAIFPFPTGPGFFLTALNTSLQQQWTWLAQTAPAYLMTFPSIVRGLAEMAAEKGHPPWRLKGITTVAEMVDSELRDLAARHLGTEIHDVYSSEEAGAMAIQCPDCRRYHVQSEAAIVEILDEVNRPCRPGESGRVVVTPLFNYATPLFRYDMGDYAEAGSACACGRGLPVLDRIRGRRRNILTLPDGRQIWPSFELRKMQTVTRIRQHKFVQTAADRIEVRLVTDEPMTPEQEQALAKIVADALPMTLTIEIRRVDTIPEPENGKYEEFISMIG